MNCEPYIGLRPFTENERDRFFGRRREISILLDKIRANRLTLLLAASGVGKSSLLQAGIMPALRADGNTELIYHRDWAASPQVFKQAVSSHYGEPYKDVPLKSILRACTLFSGGQQILLLDQFEEFFNYHRFRQEFLPFVEELSAAILDRSTPASFVISMREDFALELNAFKPFLPGVFDNYFRLEKLTREQARQAMKEPLKPTGWCFEPEQNGKAGLLEQVLNDLAKREQERQFGVQELLALKELPLLVEPPHLQIVCQELWLHHRDEAAKQISHAAYDKAGGTKGILEDYFLRKINLFSQREQRLASAAFDHLIGQRATKIAHPLDRLAELTGFQELGPVLDKLQDAAILRRQQRDRVFWYELYHDIFSESIDAWNREFKARQRMKRLAVGAVAVLIAGGLLFAGNNWRENQYGRWLQSQEGVFNRIEVNRGTEHGWDVFGRRGFLYESPFLRQELEADKRFDRGLVEDKENAQANLVGRLPLSDRLPVYVENGLYRKIYRGKEDTEDKLVETILKAGEEDLISPLPAQLAAVRTARSVELLLQLAEKKKNTGVVTALTQLGDHTALLKLLADESLRQPAVEALGSLSSDGLIVPLFIRILEDAKENVYVRQTAARVIGTLAMGGDNSATPVLVQLIKDTNTNGAIREAAVKALSNTSELIKLLSGIQDTPVRLSLMEQLRILLGDIGDVPALIKLLSHESEDVRISAAQVLGELGDSSAVPALIQLLEDTKANERVWQSAALALSQLDSSAFVKSLSKDKDTLEPAMMAVVAARGLDNSAVPTLAKLLDDTNVDESVRSVVKQMLDMRKSSTYLMHLADKNSAQTAAAGLSSLGDRSVVPDLVKLLADKNVEENVRRFVAEALGNLGDSAVVPDIIQLVEEKSGENASVRRIATYALGKLGDPSASSVLLASLDDADEEMRRYAAAALGRLGNRAALSALIRFLADKNVNASALNSFAYVLGELGDRAAVPALVKLLDDTSTETRRTAATAIGKLGDSSAVFALVKLLHVSPYALRDTWGFQDESLPQQSAVAALGELGDKSALPALIRLITMSMDVNVQRVAVAALGELGDRSPEPILMRKLRDINLKIAAAAALGQLRTTQAAPEIIRLKLLERGNMESQRTAAFALAQMNSSAPELETWRQRAFNKTQEKFASQNASQRTQAAQLLCAISTEQSAALLAQLINDPNREVKEEAVRQTGLLAELHPEWIKPEPLLALLNQPNVQLRRATIKALGQLISFQGEKTPADLPDVEQKVHAALITLVSAEQKDFAARQAALDALGAAGRYGQELFDFLAKLDKKKDDSLRYRCLHWLGGMEYPAAKDYVENELKELEQEKADWRKERQKTEQNELKQEDKSWPKEHWEYLLGNALARIAPETRGIELLGHPLYQVRQGAVRALAGKANAALIGKIIQAHQAFNPDDLPSPFPYTAFQAIDLALWNLEYTGTENDLNILKNIKLEPCKIPGQEGAIEERLEWTIKRLEDKLKKYAK
jgi:HEAT repeat protein